MADPSRDDHADHTVPGATGPVRPDPREAAQAIAADRPTNVVATTVLRAAVATTTPLMPGGTQAKDVTWHVRSHRRVCSPSSGGRSSPCNVRSTCSPYLASLFSPTPFTLLSSASDAGAWVAISRRVASWKMT